MKSAQILPMNWMDMINIVLDPSFASQAPGLFVHRRDLTLVILRQPGGCIAFCPFPAYRFVIRMVVRAMFAALPFLPPSCSFLFTHALAARSDLLFSPLVAPGPDANPRIPAKLSQPGVGPPIPPQAPDGFYCLRVSPLCHAEY